MERVIPKTEETFLQLLDECLAYVESYSDDLDERVQMSIEVQRSKNIHQLVKTYVFGCAIGMVLSENDNEYVVDLSN